MRERKWWEGLLKRTFGRDPATRTSPISNPWAGMDSLPREMMELVLDDVAEGAGDPAAASQDLANLRLVSKAARGFVDGDPLLRRVQLPGQVTELARDIAKKYPKTGLPDVHPTSDGTSNRISAGQHIAAIGPVLRFLPEDFRAKVVDDVRKLRHPSARADAILALAKHSDFTALSKPDRKFLIDDAIWLFGSGANQLTFRRMASAEALAIVHEHLEPKQHFELKQKWSGNRRLETLFDTKLRQRALSDEAGRKSQARPRITSPEIQALHRKLQKVSHSGRLNRILDRSAIERYRLPKIAAIAKALSDGVGEDYSNARTELQTRNKIRYRDRSTSRGG